MPGGEPEGRDDDARPMFVSRREEPFEEIGLHGFFDDLLYHAGKFKAKSVQISNKRPGQSIADLFGLNRKLDKITLIKRVRFLSDVPAAYTINYQSIEIVNQEKIRDEHDRFFEHCRCHLP